jgi:hypothetical protein
MHVAQHLVETQDVEGTRVLKLELPPYRIMERSIDMHSSPGQVKFRRGAASATEFAGLARDDQRKMHMHVKKKGKAHWKCTLQSLLHCLLDEVKVVRGKSVSLTPSISVVFRGTAQRATRHDGRFHKRTVPTYRILSWAQLGVRPIPSLIYEQFEAPRKSILCHVHSGRIAYGPSFVQKAFAKTARGQRVAL